jgi:hypothetical protein
LLYARTRPLRSTCGCYCVKLHWQLLLLLPPLLMLQHLLLLLRLSSPVQLLLLQAQQPALG